MTDAQSPEIEPWLQTLWDRGGSDLLLSGGSAPRIRVDGKLQPIEGEAVLTGEEIDEIANPQTDAALFRNGVQSWPVTRRTTLSESMRECST